MPPAATVALVLLLGVTVTNPPSVSAAGACGYCERRVATGAQHSCVITGSSYTAVCAGNDTASTGKLVTSYTTGWQSITAGDTFTCGLSFDGSIRCWGALPTVTTSGTVLFDSKYQDIAAGARHWCGIAWNGSAVCVGDCSSGVCTPPSGFQLLHISSGSDYACGVTTTGSVVCWGGVKSGVPAATPTIPNAVRVAAGGNHACALLAIGSAVCWGRNNWGQATPPQRVVFSALATGTNATCGITVNGSITCWGNALPRAIPPQFTNTSAAGTSAAELSCATLHCCALTRSGASAGYTLCWPLTAQATPAALATGALGASWYVAALSGLAGTLGSVDGVGTSARYRAPYQLDVADDRTVYVADNNTNNIRKISATGITTTMQTTLLPRGVALCCDTNSPTTLFATTTTNQ